MSGKKLSITDPTGTVQGLNTNVRYEKMDRDEAPKIEHRVGDIVVNFRSVHDDVVLLEGMIKKLWVDDQGVVYGKEQVHHFYEGQEVNPKDQTAIFEIVGYQPVGNYTDSYVISKFYELFPDEDGHKKDADKDQARRKNLVGMRALWEYLHTNAVVARGEFNVSSAGFLTTDGYIRSISFGNKWDLEIGVFKEEKIFQHLQEGVPELMAVSAVPVGGINRLKIKRV